MQYTVKKPINNNILRVVDPTGCELIVTGRGLGFGVKPGYKIEAETVERSYRMTSPAVQQKLVELLEQIPYAAPDGGCFVRSCGTIRTKRCPRTAG